MIKIKTLKLEKEKNIKYDFERITSPKNVFDIMCKIGINTKTQEHFEILCIDNNGNVNCIANISIGNIENATVDTRVIFQYILLSNSTRLIIVHNHPSGNLSPSKQDIEITKKIDKMCDLMQIKLLDHIIITENNYLSLKEKGAF